MLESFATVQTHRVAHVYDLVLSPDFGIFEYQNLDPGRIKQPHGASVNPIRNVQSARQAVLLPSG
jgi:hypothetical protein